jgi:branched-chain amino acid transport system substrate-binding protein
MHGYRAEPAQGFRKVFSLLFFTNLIFFTSLVLGVTFMASAETPGVSDSAILLGSCSALDGPAKFLGSQTVLGASAYLHSINDQGGVFGRKIQLLAFDDGYDPDKAQEEKIPVVGLFTGAQMLYEPLKHEVINVRASYYDETREQVDKLWEAGIHKIGVIYQDDAFGKTVLEGVKLALQKHGAAPAGLGTFARNTVDISAGLREAMIVHPQAVVVVGPYAPVAAIVKESHTQGWRPQFLTVSFVGTEAFIKEAGPDADGTIITQVVPPYDHTEYPTVALYREALAKYYPAIPPSFVSLEGFVDAMVVVEGLKRAGKDLTRDKFISAIESIHNQNLGLGPKLILSYSESDHKGFNNVYATIVRNGTPVLLTDWSGLGK